MQEGAAKRFADGLASLPGLWSDDMADPPAMEPIVGGPPVTDGRVWLPEDTDHPTSPFVIGKLARDGVKASSRSSMVKACPDRPT